MSRLKRQRLTVDGFDQVTSTADNAFRFEEQVSNNVGKGQQAQDQKGRSLFVRSLPQNATSESLTNFFSQSFALKHATVVIDSDSRQCKGYGFVTFTDAQDAQTAKNTFDGSLFEGRHIKVDTAEPRSRQGNKGSLTGGATAHTGPKRTFQHPPKLIVRNLPWTVREPEHLAVLFRSYGKVKHVTLPKKKSGQSAGFGFVMIRGRKNAERALGEVNGKEVNGRKLAVDWAVEKNIWDKLQNGSERTETRDPDLDARTFLGDTDNVTPEESHHFVLNDIPRNVLGRSASSDREGRQIQTGQDKGEDESKAPIATDDTKSTLFVRNLPFSSTDESLRTHFELFGPVRYARVILDRATERPKGTGFVCFFRQEHADSCLREAPRTWSTPHQRSTTAEGATKVAIKQSLIQDMGSDPSGNYTVDGRVLHVFRAVDRVEAARLTSASNVIRDAQDKDRRRLYLLSEGVVPSNTILYKKLSPSEISMREDSAKQRQSLIRSNPMLHLSLTRLSIRNLPHSITSKDLKALAREAVVGFAKDVKNGLRMQLSKEELLRGGEEMKQAEKARKAKGKGIVKQAKIVFEGREGNKVTEDSGAGRSRGYGFIEYSSHRWALMGLRWLNGHAVAPAQTACDPNITERSKRLITEFAIENAQVVERRRERETKARERSTFISEKLDKRGKSNAMSKTLIEDQSIARMQRNVQRKRKFDPKALMQNATQHSLKAYDPVDDSEKLAKRQHIIGRKRMMRRSRRRVVSK